MKSIVTMTTKHGVSYKRTKCLDEWTDNVNEAYRYTVPGAKRIAERLNNTLEVDG